MSESKCYAADGVTECHSLHGVGVLVSAVAFNGLLSENETLRAELAAKEKALSSAKIALDAKDRSYSVIEQRFSAMAAKAATTDSERECNERLTAEIDALTAELNAIKMALRMGHSLLKYQVEFLVAMTERAIATPPEIAGLADKLEEIASYDPPFDCEVFYQAAAALRARAVPEAVAKDAARYRWLRDGNVTGKLSVGEMTEISDKGWERVTWLYDEELDAEIDAAILSATDSEVKK